jgi:hypothetical protein
MREGDGPLSSSREGLPTIEPPWGRVNTGRARDRRLLLRGLALPTWHCGQASFRQLLRRRRLDHARPPRLDPREGEEHTTDMHDLLVSHEVDRWSGSRSIDDDS